MVFGLLTLLVAAPQPDLPRLPPPGVVEVAPAPHLPSPPFSLAAVKGGYRVSLNRRTAELLQDALDRIDEKELAAKLREKAKERKEADPDDSTVATLEMIAFAVQTQLPGFKKSLAENMGLDGVVITLTGLQKPTVTFRKPRPRLERAAELVRDVMPLLPAEAREAVEAMRAVARTTPLFWKVEPRG
jgi:hypothetical protein